MIVCKKLLSECESLIASLAEDDRRQEEDRRQEVLRRQMTESSSGSNRPANVPTGATIGYTAATNTGAFPRLPPIAQPDLTRTTLGAIPIQSNRPATYASQAAIGATSTVVGLQSGQGTGRHPLKVQLNRLLALNLPGNDRRVVPERFGKGWPDGSVFPKRMGADGEPHPGACQGIYGAARRGCATGDACGNIHRWLDEDEIIFLITNPDPAKAAKAKQWLQEALNNYLANVNAGRVKTRIEPLPPRSTGYVVAGG